MLLVSAHICGGGRLHGEPKDGLCGRLHTSNTQGEGEGVLPYMGYIGMCSPKGYGFSAVLVINRVPINLS